MDFGNRQQDSLVSNLINLILQHGSEPLTEARLADLAAYSVTHIRRVFFSATGESLGDFMRRVRLERAAGELSIGSQSVTAIALGANYLSGEAFARAFNARFQSEPTKFRSLNQGASCLLPGYIYSADPTKDSMPFEVGIRTAEERITTYIYFGPNLVDRIEPESSGDRVAGFCPRSNKNNV
jgi:AraC family transcriptional regulator